MLRIIRTDVTLLSEMLANTKLFISSNKPTLQFQFMRFKVKQSITLKSEFLQDDNRICGCVASPNNYSQILVSADNCKGTFCQNVTEYREKWVRAFIKRICANRL